MADWYATLLHAQGLNIKTKTNKVNGIDNNNSNKNNNKKKRNNNIDSSNNMVDSGKNGNKIPNMIVVVKK